MRSVCRVRILTNEEAISPIRSGRARIAVDGGYSHLMLHLKFF